jgi:hypothetical protein
MQRDQAYPETMCDGDDAEYKLVQFLGQGAQGAVYLYAEVPHNELWAIKFDPIGTKDSSLLTESTFLKNYSAGNDRLPRYKNHGKLNGRRYLIMENLEHSIEEYIEMKKKEPGCNFEAMIVDLAC